MDEQIYELIVFEELENRTDRASVCEDYEQMLCEEHEHDSIDVASKTLREWYEIISQMYPPQDEYVGDGAAYYVIGTDMICVEIEADEQAYENIAGITAAFGLGFLNNTTEDAEVILSDDAEVDEDIIWRTEHRNDIYDVVVFEQTDDRMSKDAIRKAYHKMLDEEHDHASVDVCTERLKKWYSAISTIYEPARRSDCPPDKKSAYYTFGTDMICVTFDYCSGYEDGRHKALICAMQTGLGTLDYTYEETDAILSDFTQLV